MEPAVYVLYFFLKAETLGAGLSVHGKAVKSSSLFPIHIEVWLVKVCKEVAGSWERR